MLMVFRLIGAAVLGSALAVPAVAGPVTTIDIGRGVPGTAPQFTWHGLTFELQGQPAGRVSVDHRVEVDPHGALRITLEEGRSSAVGTSAKVTYGATLSDVSSVRLG